MFTAQEKALIVRWLARLLGGAMLLFWGAFFVEHLVGWFIDPLPKTPPLHVWCAQFLHFLLLLSYIVAMKWDVAGGCLILGSAAAFFIGIGINVTLNMALYIGLTLLPGILLLVAWRLGHSRQATGP